MKIPAGDESGFANEYKELPNGRQLIVDPEVQDLCSRALGEVERPNQREVATSLTPRLGRARPLAERSIGHPDAGAISLAMCAETAREAVTRFGETR